MEQRDTALDARYTAPEGETATLARVTGETGGDLVLKRVGAHYEIYSNGLFLMDTRDGTSEREMVRVGLTALPAGRSRASVLVGGLGVGFTAREALDHPRVARVDVVELEAQVIAWHDGELGEAAEYVHRDPRCRVHNADIVAWVDRAAAAADPARYDLICLDTDNGPDWTVIEGNGRLYEAAGLDRLTRLLTPGGLLSFWSANAVPSFEAALTARFASVRVIEVPVARGVPDTIYLASEPRRSPQGAPAAP